MNGGPQTLTDWIQYLHTAAAVPKDSPDYAEARQAVGHALLHINALNVGSTMGEANQAERVSTALAVPAALAHGASLGMGEPLSGLGSALTGNGFRQGAQAYREGMANVEASHPELAAGSELLGGAVLPAGVIGSGVGSAIKAGVPLTLGQGAALLGRSALSGAVPAAIAGFSAGGEDPGDFAARGRSAAVDAAIGAALGAIAGGLGAKATRAHVEHVADIAQKGAQRALTASRLAESQGRLARMQATAAPAVDPMRAALLAAGVKPENLEAQLARNAAPPPPPAAGGLLAPSMPVAPPPVQGPSGLLGDVPLQSTVPNAETLLGNELSAAAETAARKQQGLTKAQLAYREAQFAGPRVKGSYANLRARLEDPTTSQIERARIIKELRQRKIVDEYTSP